MKATHKLQIFLGTCLKVLTVSVSVFTGSSPASAQVFGHYGISHGRYGGHGYGGYGDHHG